MRECGTLIGLPSRSDCSANEPLCLIEPKQIARLMTRKSRVQITPPLLQLETTVPSRSQGPPFWFSTSGMSGKASVRAR